MALFDDIGGSSGFADRGPSVLIFGTLCFLLGSGFLFLVSFGRWRVRHWPTYSKDRRMPLEPTRVRVGRKSYFCADVAMFIGFILLLIVGFFIGLVVGIA